MVWCISCEMFLSFCAAPAGGIAVPPTARMHLQITNRTVGRLEFVNVVDQPTGSGMMFMHTLSFSAPNLNTLEGCYHSYTPYSQAWPGLTLATGTEDLFISAYYFSAGQFRLSASGLTHFLSNSSLAQVSAYR